MKPLGVVVSPYLAAFLAATRHDFARPVVPATIDPNYVRS